MGRVFITRTVPGRAVAMLEEAGHEVEVWPGGMPPSPEELAERLRDADAVMAMVVDSIDGELLAGAPRLRIIANMAVGYDNCDPAVAARAGVWLTNTPGVLAETTADHAFALLLAIARRVVEGDADTRAGGWRTWSPTAFLGMDVHGATLGVVGLGEIGRAVARRAQGFGMRVLYTARSRKEEAEEDLGVEYTGLPELLERADFVSLHVPLNAETRHLIGREAFGMMRKEAYLVNTARGQVVDQDALVEALRAGEIAGAALDVTDPEPLPAGHPLLSMPNVIVTPHIASATVATRSRMAEMAAGNIIAALSGREPPNALNRVEGLR